MAAFKPYHLFPMILILSALLVLFGGGCQKERSQAMDEPIYMNNIAEWQQMRLANLTRTDGWLTLTGLFWLEEGENNFGSAVDNDLVFPGDDLPPFMGKFILDGQSVTIEVQTGVMVLHEQKPVTQMTLLSDAQGKPTVLTYGNHSWHIIKRGERYGVRLRNSEAEALKSFKGIETYPINLQWRIPAKLIPYQPPKKIDVPNVLGTVSAEECPGALQFEIDGKLYQLDVIAESDAKQYFIIFADDTNGEETYAAGRFLYADRADKQGKTYIDFNKAYNPPCAFSNFATCPLPPLQNRLPVKITAGEKNYAGSDH